ncbi:MAG: ATP-binding cassette domain-containing protein [Bacillota bacterium]
MPLKPILEAKEVSFRYPDGTPALENVTLAVAEGQKTAFLGPNGAGKTTLFLHFNGLFRPVKGKISFAGREVRYDRASLLELRKNVGIVFQDPETQLFSASVWQEVSFGPLNLGLPAPEVKERVLSALSAAQVLDLKDRPTHFLSYGQKKRVAIADILAMHPRVLICDEPTAWLDTRRGKQIMDLFAGLNASGTTIVFSTHDVDLAYSWADYVFLLKDGMLIGEGPPEAVFGDPRLLAAAELEKPWVVEVYEELQRKGWVAGRRPPRSKEELLALIGERGVRGAELGKVKQIPAR